MKRVRAVVVAASVVGMLGLTACASATDSETDPETPLARGVTCLPEGSTASSIQVSDDADPKLTLPGAVSVTESERTVLNPGDGEAINEGDTVRVAMVIANGSDGTELDRFGFADSTQVQTFPVKHGSVLPGFVDALGCLNVGGEALAVLSPEDTFGEEGYEAIGVGPNESIVVLLKVLGKQVTRADGVDQEPVAGFPTVTLDADGAPTVTVPEGAAPAEFRLAVLKKGSGAVVADDADVLVQYSGVNWRTGQVFDSSWGRGTPTSFSLLEVVPGFTEAIAGQTIGSQVIVIVPPDMAYGPQGGVPSIGIEADDTLIFVIDILDAA